MPPVVARRPHAGRPPPSTPRRPRRVLPVQVPCLPGPPCRSRSARREREPLPPRVSAGMVGDRDRARVLLALCCPTTPSRRCKPLVRPPACAAPRGRRQTAPPRRRPPRRRIGRTPYYPSWAPVEKTTACMLSAHAKEKSAPSSPATGGGVVAGDLGIHVITFGSEKGSGEPRIRVHRREHAQGGVPGGIDRPA